MARRRKTEKAADHTRGMLAYVVKQGGTNQLRSNQIRDPFASFYTQGLALEPPLAPERLLQLLEENSIHAAAIMTKADDAAGRGYDFVAPENVNQAPTPREPDQVFEPIAVPSNGNGSAMFEPIQQRRKYGALRARIRKEDGVQVAGQVDQLDPTLPARLKEQLEDLTPDYTFSEMLTQAATELESIGWSSWEVVRNPDGTIGAMYPLPAHTLRATIDDEVWLQVRAGRIRYFKVFGSQKRIHSVNGKEYGPLEVPQDPAHIATELILFKTYSPRSQWYGIPRWVSAIPTIAELTAIREFNVSWFSSGGQTDRSIHVNAAEASAAQRIAEEIRQQLEANRGLGHTTLVTSGSPDVTVNVVQLTQQLRDGHFRFRRTDLIKEVLIVHNVPPYRVGWAELGSLGGSAAKEMLEAYQIGSVKPLQRVIEDRVKMTLFNPDKGGIDTGGYQFKLAEIDLTQMEQDLDRASRGVSGGFVTPNQAREMVGEDKVNDRPELDVYYFNGQRLRGGVEQLGALIRAGFDPAESLAAVGLPPIKHLGIPPITVQPLEGGGLPGFGAAAAVDPRQQMLEDLVEALRTGLEDPLPAEELVKRATEPIVTSVGKLAEAVASQEPPVVHVHIPEAKKATMVREVVRDDQGRIIQTVDTEVPQE